jgi:predicted GIY-YIG superfamily endonuclease
MSYYCYLLIADNDTYIGITNNLEKRLEKHNGLIEGGAKATRKHNNWVFHTIIGDFADKGEAASFEWYAKHVQSKNGKWRRTDSGIDNKLKRINELLLMDKWNDKCIVAIQ